MKYKGLIFLTTFLISVFTVAASAQSDKEFLDPGGKFKLTLAGDWRAVSYSDGVGRQKTEFVYKDRSEGLLKITKERLSANSLADMVQQEEESIRIYRSGYDRAAREPFGGGGLSGMRLSFYNNEGGRQLASTYYFLKDGNSVWVLRFTGKRGSLDSNRNLTDQIARSFSPM